MSTSESKAAASRREAAEVSTDSGAASPEQLTHDPVVADSPATDTTLPETAPMQTLPLDEAHPGMRTEDAAERPVEKIARPRIRWGAIVWGLLVCAIAVVTLTITRTDAARESFVLWLTRLAPGGIWLIVVLVAGGILLLLGLLAAIRRAQRAR